MASRIEIVCIVVWSFILACNIESASGDLLLVPPQAEVIRGGKIIVPCATTYRSQYDVQWQHTPVGSNGAIDIFFTGYLNRKFQGKYNVTKDKDKGEYNLTILSAVPNDAGTYTCIDKGGAGEQRRTALIVLDSKPVGQSNVSLDQLTICGEEADHIGLSCHVNYTGDESPSIEWRQIKNGTELPLAQVPPDVRHESVSYHLAMRIDPSMNGSTLRCLSTLGKFSWTSEKLIIEFALNTTSFTSTNNATKQSCNAVSNQPCTYKWTSNTNDMESIYSDSEMMDFSKVESGIYVCTAECNVGAKICTVHPKIIEYNSAEGTGGLSTLAVIGIIFGILVGVVILPVLVALVLIRHWRRKYPPGKKEEKIPLLSEENLTPSSNIDKLIVRGIAELGRKIYVIFQEQKFIRVIVDLEKFEKGRDIPFDMVVDPWDLEPCAENLCLYVADRDPNNCIWKVNLRNDKTEKWLTNLRKPHKFSVISRGRVAIPKWQQSIEIWASDGSLEQIINLPQDMLEPYSVLQTRDENFIVAHGHQKSNRHRVCELQKQDSEWQIRWSYPEDGEDKINNIDILAMDNSGRIFVTDQNNLRIVLLSSRGNKMAEIKLEEFPYRLCYAKDHERLLVGHRGAISAYEVDAQNGEIKPHLLNKFVCERFSCDDGAKTKKLVQKSNMQWSKSSDIHQDIGERVVSGITELKSKFYVVLQDQPAIHVYDGRDMLEEITTIPVEELSDPWFIDACPLNNCLYVTDKKRRCVLKVSGLDEVIETVIWKSTLGEPHKLAVISKGRVLIPSWPSTLEIYDSEGNLVDSIPLPQEMREPCHAVETEDGSYILGHGDKKNNLHRVCKVTWSRKPGCVVVWTYGDQRGNKEFQLNRPRNIAIGEKGKIFVTDEGNKRLVLLDRNGYLQSTENTTITPERLFYSKSTRCLLVGHYGSISRYFVDEENRLRCSPLTSIRCLRSTTDA